MLKYLHIENIAVIEQTDLTFTDGFNVLTGETGAGKSIIIDAINAILGERTSKELIRNGCNSAVVSATFGALSPAVQSLITERGFFADENAEYIIQRVLTTGGSSIRINGQPVSAAQLKSFSHFLISIHGQHDNESLLNPDNHYLYLDKLAENVGEAAEYLTEFQHFNTVRAHLKEIDCDEDEKLRRIDLLKYQIAELEGAGIRPGEFEELKQKSRIARSLQKKTQLLDELLIQLNGDDESAGAISLVTSVAAVLCDGNFDELSDVSGSLSTCNDLLCTVKDRLSDYKEQLNSGEYDSDAIEARLDMLSGLMRKYGNTEEKMLSFLSSAAEELSRIDFDDAEAERLAKELELSQRRLVLAAKALTKTRLNAAEYFEKSVTSILCQLNMQNVSLKVERKEGRYTRHGCDEIQFFISTNAGEELKPLSKVASGGELSRVMLAIKSVLADRDDVDTLIFDEIDTGISGRTADSVGVQLEKVAVNRQVICVTHLAQIAVCAGQHLLIEKSVRENRTYTDVKLLDGDERTAEIARIMGGNSITPQLLVSAAQLLNEHKK